jgi:pyruvate,water dikinase
MAYRVEQRVTAEPAIAVVVQLMIASERSGVMFTADPATGATDRIIIEAVLGQGEAIVSGMVEPDTYRVAKTGPALLSVRTGYQQFAISRAADGSDHRVELDATAAAAQVLPEEHILEIARLGIATEQQYGKPQDIARHRVGDRRGHRVSRPVPPDHHPFPRGRKRGAADAGPATGPASRPCDLAGKDGRPGPGVDQPHRAGAFGGR